MTLLLLITAAVWLCFGASCGYLAGHFTARRRYQEQLAEITALNHQLYEQPAYGDD